jgi:microcystin-dependent protein
MAGLLKELRELPSTSAPTLGGGDYLHIKQGDSDRKIRVFDLLKQHNTDRTSNPHGITKEMLLLGNVDNDLQLKRSLNLTDVLDTEIARNHLGVYSKEEAGVKLDEHASRVDNPHSLTKSQLGLGNVDNFSSSSSATNPSTTTFATSAAVNKITTRLNSADSDNTVFQRGMIIMWHSSVAPAGWEICNGGTHNGLAVPDMRNRFPVGAGSSYGYKSTGGVTTTSHNHGGSVLNHRLTLSQIPSHSHVTPIDSKSSWSEPETCPTKRNSVGEDANADYVAEQRSSSAGGGGSHNHGLSINSKGLENRPPYIGVYFIIKL